MTAETATPQAQPRGAGSGEKANATRSRNIVDWPPEPKSHSEHVEELEAERDAQAEFNAEMADMQQKQAADFTEKVKANAAASDGDEQREAAREAAAAANDPKKKEAALKGEMDARAKREKAAQQGQR